MRTVPSIFAIALMIAPEMAAADVTTITSAGTIYYGKDITGVLGSPGTNLTNLPYSFIFKYDSAVPNRVVHNFPDDITHYGGPANGFPVDMTVTLNIGSYPTINLVGTYSYYNDSSNRPTYYLDDRRLHYDRLFSIGYNSDGELFDFYTPAPHFAEQAFAFYYEDTSSETVTPSASVPEPGPWAMMLVGMGAMGFVMRRRTKLSISHA